MCPTKISWSRSIVCLLTAIALCPPCCVGRYREALAVQCDKGKIHDCLALGYMLVRGQDGHEDPARALEYFVRSCELGNSIGCKKAGEIWKSGAIGFKNLQKAEMYFRMAQELTAQELDGTRR